MADRPPETLVSRTLPRPRETRPEVHHSSLNRNDLLFAIFKHKWMILLFGMAGALGAVAVYFLYPPIYQSEAKLLMRYVLERSGVDPIESSRSSGGLDQASDNILGSEVEILSSWDLAVQTAEAIGVKRLLPHATGTPSKEAAARTVASGLEVTVHKGSNIMFVSYKNRDPELATLVLNELVNRYFNKHLEVHRSAGAFDFVTQQTDQVRSRLNQTEDALRALKGKLGIVSLTDSATALSTEAVKTEDQLHDVDAELAEQQALVQQFGGASVELSPKNANSAAKVVKPDQSGSPADKAASPAPEPPSSVVEQYQVLISRLPQLRQARMDLLSKYTPENQLVKANRADIEDVENQRRALESKYPNLPSKVGPIGSANSPQSDFAAQSAHLAGLTAKREALASRLRDVRDRIKELSQIGPQIADLDRQKELEEANYKYFEATLEKARIDEALDPSKIPNISAVQRPSPPILMTKTRDKMALALAAGGLALGVAIALLKEIVLSHNIKRPVELERFVGVSPLLSIPYNAAARLQSGPKSNGKTMPPAAKQKQRSNNIAPWDANHFIRPYCEAIRDRLGLYFELNRLTHKPKLVGVAGFSEGLGTSTLAAGLASALSGTNDGKVLLVDVNLGPEHVHPFFKGRPAYPLNTALMPSGPMAAAADNLYLATVGSPNAGPAQLGLKKFFDLMPNLKASDFDYIIFDMPPLSETSPTWGMAAFMDKVLLVVEAEKNNREVVKRGYRKLVSERDNVSVVLNKARSYGPKWLVLEG